MRNLVVAAAQMGPVGRDTPKSDVVARMLGLMREAHRRGVRHLVYPEFALTTFFPRDYYERLEDIDRYFETSMPGPTTLPLFALAADLRMGFTLGYAEHSADGRRFNSSVLVGESGNVVGTYRKVHLPGTSSYDPGRRWQQLEKLYFSQGDLGFRVWRSQGINIGMCLCNDRRWPESFRVLGLQDAELITIGYCTPALNTVAPERESAQLRQSQSELTLRAGAYQNACFVVASAKAGTEEGCAHMAGSLIIAPTGEILAKAQSADDEVVSAQIDLDDCAFYKRGLFDFAAHRRPEAYQLICERAGALAPNDPFRP